VRRLLIMIVLIASCSGGAPAELAPDAGYSAPALGASCECPEGASCELEACGDRAYCGSGLCTIECESSADCPTFAMCTEGSNGVRGCYYGCHVDAHCPTTTPTCVGVGFGHCEE
jgi:hypothetical protein